MKTRYKILILLPMLWMLNKLIAEQQHISQVEMLAKVVSVTFQFFVLRVGLVILLLFLFLNFIGEILTSYVEHYMEAENIEEQKKE